MALWDRECKNCWKIFTPRHSKNKFCSKNCAQRFMWDNKTEEEKSERIDRLRTGFMMVSKTNLSYKSAL